MNRTKSTTPSRLLTESTWPNQQPQSTTAINNFQLNFCWFSHINSSSVCEQAWLNIVWLKTAWLNAVKFSDYVTNSNPLRFQACLWIIFRPSYEEVISLWSFLITNHLWMRVGSLEAQFSGASTHVLELFLGLHMKK
jgi:hypothetical protein